MYQAGVENVVASSGTSLTEGQIRLIRRFTSNITILYDGDAAGLKASFRGIDMILQEGMNVRVVLFPDGEDPDSYAKSHSTEELKEYIASNSKDFIRFKTSVLLKDVGDDPIKKASLVKDIVKSIAIIPDQIKRSVYTQECSNLLDIPEQALINETNTILRQNIAKKTKFSSSKTGTFSSQSPSEELPDDLFFPEEYQSEKETDSFSDLKHWEREIIRLLVTFGDQTIKLEIPSDEKKKEFEEVTASVYIVENINNDNILFENKSYQKLFNFYVQKLNNEELPTHQDFINHTDQEISKMAIDILSIQHDLSPGWEKNKIFTTTEEMQLSLAIVRVLFAFQLSKLSALIFKNQNQLKTEKDTDIQMELLQEQVNLQQIKLQIAAKLGRIILK
jgi:DNA primase